MLFIIFIVIFSDEWYADTPFGIKRNAFIMTKQDRHILHVMLQRA